MKIKIRPLPQEVFAPNAVIDCIGKPFKNKKGEVIGTIISYEIVRGDLLLTVDLIDLKEINGSM